MRVIIKNLNLNLENVYNPIMDVTNSFLSHGRHKLSTDFNSFSESFSYGYKDEVLPNGKRIVKVYRSLNAKRKATHYLLGISANELGQKIFDLHFNQDVHVLKLHKRDSFSAVVLVPVKYKLESKSFGFAKLKEVYEPLTL